MVNDSHKEELYGCFLKWGYPQIIQFSSIYVYIYIYDICDLIPYNIHVSISVYSHYTSLYQHVLIVE